MRRRPLLTGPATIAAALVLLMSSCSSAGETPLDMSKTAAEAPAGAAPTPAMLSETETADSGRLTTIADLGDTVTGIASIPDGSGLLVGTRTGLVYFVRLTPQERWVETALDPTPVLDLSADTSTEGERGLLDVAVDSDGSNVFLSFTSLDGSVTLRRFELIDGDTPRLEPVGDVIVLPHPFSGHNGGDVAVDSHGGVYLSVGDMATTDPPLAQIPDNQFGKVLYLSDQQVDAASDGPIDPADARTVALGLRNPWRIALDETEDALWIADVGESDFEEIDRIDGVSTTDDVPNFGWPYFEGNTVFDEPAPEGADFVEPLWVREHSASVCAITGGTIYRGAAFAGLNGHFLFGDSCGPEILVFDPADGGSETIIATAPSGVATFGTGTDGEVYVGATGGTLLRLDPSDWAVRDGTEAVGPPPTTEAPPASELCEVPAIFADLGAAVGAAPAQAETALDSAQERLAAVPTPSTPALQRDLNALIDAAASMRAAAELVGWNLDDPGFQSFVADLTTGRGDVPDFAGALQRITTSAGDCPEP